VPQGTARAVAVVGDRYYPQTVTLENGPTELLPGTPNHHGTVPGVVSLCACDCVAGTQYYRADNDRDHYHRGHIPRLSEQMETWCTRPVALTVAEVRATQSATRCDALQHIATQRCNVQRATCNAQPFATCSVYGRLGCAGYDRPHALRSLAPSHTELVGSSEARQGRRGRARRRVGAWHSR
jgi:hypothetical protein